MLEAIAGLFGGVFVRIPRHLRPRLATIRSLPITEPRPPWRKVTTAAVGGLTAVGFVGRTDTLLVLSHNGRALFDCVSGKRIYRDDDQASIVNLGTLETVGMGDAENLSVRVSGLYGGGLLKMTEDGWSLEREPLAWPDEHLILAQPGHSVLHGPPDAAPALTRIGRFTSDVRAFGFSATGRSLIIATGADVMIYAR